MLVNLQQSHSIVNLDIEDEGSTDLVKEVMSQDSGKAHPHVRHSIIHETQ
jgi:hypothetical protein